MKSALQDHVDNHAGVNASAGIEHGKDVQRILVLTSSLGAGHVQAGQAVIEALEEKHPGVECRAVDFWSLMDDRVASVSKQSYLDLVDRFSQNYQRIFDLDGPGVLSVMQRGTTLDPMLAEGFRMLAERDLSGGTEAGGIDSAFDRMLFRLLRWSFPGHRQTQGHVAIAVRRGVIGLGQWCMAMRLRDIINGFEPDCIVVTQPLPAALLSLIGKRNPIGVPVVGVLVNWGAIEFYAQAAIDFYCVPHESIPLLELLEPFVVTGMPLRKGFRNPPRREEARRQLHLDPEKPAVLVQGGGLGLHVVRLARALLSLANVQILVQAGNNQMAWQELQDLSNDHGGRLKVSRWTDEMQVYICAADVVVGKPGGMTVGECLACGRPLIVIDSLRGQETLNLQFIEQMGVGWEVAEQDLVPTVTSLLDDRERLRQIQQRAWDIGERRGAERVADLVGSCTVEQIHA